MFKDSVSSTIRPLYRYEDYKESPYEEKEKRNIISSLIKNAEIQDPYENRIVPSIKPVISNNLKKNDISKHFITDEQYYTLLGSRVYLASDHPKVTIENAMKNFLEYRTNLDEGKKSKRG
jgi:hypothetical protein